MINQMDDKIILLRKATYDDLNDIYNNVWNDKMLFVNMFYDGSYSLDEAEARLKRTIEYQKNHYSYFIEYKNTKEVIGFCGVLEQEEHSFIETGICISKKYQNIGIGTKTLGMLIDLLFNKLDCDKFICSAVRNNTKSKKMFARYNFDYFNTTVEKREYDNESLICDYYVLTKDKYLKKDL